MTAPTISLAFPLDVEDEWPPVAVECLPFTVSCGNYVALAPPLFVKNLSVGDVIEATLADDGHHVESWRTILASGHTTVWLLRLAPSDDIASVLSDLHALGCTSAGLETAGCYAVDVPESVAIHEVDAVLALLDDSNVAVAFPSMRHENEQS